jgi:hypothetical protein
MLPQILIAIGAAVFALLGTIHLVYTFFTDNFDPRDAATSAAMKATSPILTRRLTMWSAWIGFNASHSLGVLLFGVIYLVLALGHMSVLRDSPTLSWLPVATGAAYMALARRYWFRNPLIGVSIATACFLAAALALSF